MNKRVITKRHVSSSLLAKIMWAATNSLDCIPRINHREDFVLKIGLRKRMQKISTGLLEWDKNTCNKVDNFSNQIDANVNGIFKLMERLKCKSLYLFGYEKHRIKRLICKARSRVIWGWLCSAHIKIVGSGWEHSFKIEQDGTVYEKDEKNVWDISNLVYKGVFKCV